MAELAIITGIILSILSILVFLWLPGRLIYSLSDRDATSSFADAFFAGWLWLVVVGITSSVVVVNPDQFTLLVRIISGIFIVTLLAINYYGRKASPQNQDIQGINTGILIDKIGIGIVVNILFFSYLVTHNLGYDDVSNLQYLWRGSQESIFPLYRTLVGHWQAARYPAFGPLNIILSQGITGGVFYVYYLLGGVLFACFFIKIYEWCIEATENRLKAFTGVILVASLLMFAGLVNYFNHGVYPFQQSKLLFIAGIIYLVRGWHKNQLTLGFVLGSGLLVAAWLQHLNTVLLYVLVFPALFLAAIVLPGLGTAKLKKGIVLICFPLLLSLPAYLAPGKGYIRYKEPPKIVAGVPDPNYVPPTFWQRIGKRVMMVMQWVQNGRQKEAYFSRIISFEIPLVVLVVILFSHYRFRRRYVDAGIISLLLALMSFHTIQILPRQALVAFYRSGPFLMLVDFWRSNLSSANNYISDPYTALYFRVLSGGDIRALSDSQHLFAFSPLVARAEAQNFFSDTKISDDRLLIFNGRFEGEKALKCLSGEEQNDIERLEDNTRKWLDEGNFHSLQQVLYNIAGHFIEQVRAPVILLDNLNQVVRGKKDTCVSDREVALYKGGAAVNFNEKKKGDSVKMTFRFRDDQVDTETSAFAEKQYPVVITLGDEPDFSSRYYKGFREQLVEIAWLEGSGPSRIYFQTTGYGHFGGLGSMESVSFTK